MRVFVAAFQVRYDFSHCQLHPEFEKLSTLIQPSKHPDREGGGQVLLANTSCTFWKSGYFDGRDHPPSCLVKKYPEVPIVFRLKTCLTTLILQNYMTATFRFFNQNKQKLIKNQTFKVQKWYLAKKEGLGPKTTWEEKLVLKIFWPKI